MKDVGIRIKNLREQKGMTQKNLADRANITVATLSRYENNQRTPMSDIIVKIARALGTSTDYLLTGDGEIEKKYHEHNAAVTMIGFASRAREITPRQAAILQAIAEEMFGSAS